MPSFKRALRPAVFFALITVPLAGCYVVPAPAPLGPGVAPAPPPYVLATPQCRWEYGWGWYGWGWYGLGC